MRILTLLVLIFVFAGCQPSKRDCDFTFFKGNIRESYFLKFNSSDTVYFINTYPFEEQTSYTILSREEKEKIESILENIDFPIKEDFTNNSIEDGENFAFFLNCGKLTRKLIMHGHSGPQQFWLFRETLVEIRSQHKFIKLDRKFDVSDINKMFKSPLPPIINK